MQLFLPRPSGFGSIPFELHRKGFVLGWSACWFRVVAWKRGRRGWGRFPGMSWPGWVGWVREEGRLEGWWLAGRGKEALYGRELAGGTGDVELGRI